MPAQQQPQRRIGPERPPQLQQQPQLQQRRIGPERPPQSQQTQTQQPQVQTQQTQTEQAPTQQTQTQRLFGPRRLQQSQQTQTEQVQSQQTQTQRLFGPRRLPQSEQTQTEQAQTQQTQTEQAPIQQTQTEQAPIQQTQTQTEQEQQPNPDCYHSLKPENILLNGVSGLCNGEINYEHNYYQYVAILDREQYLDQKPWHTYLFKVKFLLFSLFRDEVFNEHNRWRAVEVIFPFGSPPQEHLPKAWGMQIDWYKGLVDRKRLRQQICAELLAALAKIAVSAGGAMLVGACIGLIPVPVAGAVGAGAGALTAAAQFAIPRLLHLHREIGYKKQLIQQAIVVDTSVAQLTTQPSAKQWQGFFSEFYFLMGRTFDPQLIFKRVANTVYFEPFKSKTLNLKKIDLPILNNLVIEGMKAEEFNNIDIFWNGSSYEPMRDLLYFNYGLLSHLEDLREKFLLTNPALRWAESLEESMYATRFYFLSRTFYMSSFFSNFIPAIDNFCQRMLHAFDASKATATLNLQSYSYNLMYRLQSPPTNQSLQVSLEHTEQALVTAVIQSLKHSGITDEKTLNILCSVFQKIFLNTTFPTNIKLKEMITQYPHIVNPIIHKYAKYLIDFLDATFGAAGKLTNIFIYSFFVNFVWCFDADLPVNLLFMQPCAAVVQQICDPKVKKAAENVRNLFISNKRLYNQLNTAIKITIGVGRVAVWGVQLGLGHFLIPAIGGVAGVAVEALSLALFAAPLTIVLGALTEWLKSKYFNHIDTKLLAAVEKIIKIDENEKIVFLKPQANLSKQERKLIFIEFGHFLHDKMRALESPFKNVLALKIKLESFKRDDKIVRHLFQTHAVREFQQIIKSFVTDYVDYLKQIYQIQTILNYCKLYSAAIKALYDDYKTIGGTTHCQIGQMALQLLALYNKYQSSFTPEEVDVVMQLNVLYNGIAI